MHVFMFLLLCILLFIYFQFYWLTCFYGLVDIIVHAGVAFLFITSWRGFPRRQEGPSYNGFCRRGFTPAWVGSFATTREMMGLYLSLRNPTRRVSPLLLPQIPVQDSGQREDYTEPGAVYKDLF